MVVEFVTKPQFNFLKSLAEVLNVPVIDNEIHIPSNLGEGSIRRIDIHDDFRMIIHRFRLNEELILKRIGTTETATNVSIVFYNNEAPLSLVMDQKESLNFNRYNDVAIQITSNSFDSLITFPADTEIYYTILVLSVSRLKSLLQLGQPDPLINAILNPTESFLFYESMKAETQATLRQLYSYQSANGLSAFFYRIKAETLLFDVFNQLRNRHAAGPSTINKADVSKLFLLREAILCDLSHQPSLSDLAKLAGMSETKMKDLFRHVFGDSIYNYYQIARMEEAAYLLRYGNYSVSEVGYKLGFSNLSHFTRLFERHHNQKPKKYALGR